MSSQLATDGVHQPSSSDTDFSNSRSSVSLYNGNIEPILNESKNADHLINASTTRSSALGNLEEITKMTKSLLDPQKSMYTNFGRPQPDVLSKCSNFERFDRPECDIEYLLKKYSGQPLTPWEKKGMKNNKYPLDYRKSPFSYAIGDSTNNPYQDKHPDTHAKKPLVEPDFRRQDLSPNNNTPKKMKSVSDGKPEPKQRSFSKSSTKSSENDKGEFNATNNSCPCGMSKAACPVHSNNRSPNGGCNSPCGAFATPAKSPCHNEKKLKKKKGKAKAMDRYKKIEMAKSVYKENAMLKKESMQLRGELACTQRSLMLECAKVLHSVLSFCEDKAKKGKTNQCSTSNGNFFRF